ncbi:MAG: hypothetical protein PF447_02425 [Spirochaetaceae bacterium]|jgi:2',3'-cyclic-nucleotide 2'-phosphodiesterase (5'-nucleotidase family)|nr:hypothetical protein [Spirochaetaceae bacterium]
MKNPLRLLIFLVLLSPLQSQGSVTLYYSSSLNGNLNGCECHENPKAGLIKRAHYLRSIESEESILIDLGDMMDIFPDRELHNIIASAYVDLGYDLLLPGDQDWNEGVDWLIDSGIPLAADNISLLVDGQEEALSQPRIIRRNGLTVGIISLVQKSVYNFIPQEAKERLIISDPFPVAQDFSQELNDKCDIQILLYHGYLEDAQMIARIAPDIDVILLAHEQRLINLSEQAPAILSPGTSGNSLGILSIHIKRRGRITLDNRFEEFSYLDSPDDAQLRQVADEYLQGMLLP